MTIVKRFKSAPWAKVFKVLGWFVLVLTCVTGIPMAVMHFPTGGWNEAFAQLAIHAVFSLILAWYGLFLFTFVWTAYDVPQGWQNIKQFVRDLPENWRRFRGGCAALFVFLLNLPGMCVRGIRSAFRWVGSLPRRWHETPARDKAVAGWMTTLLAVLAAVAYFMWPYAVGTAQWLPAWLTHGDILFFAMILDMFMSMMSLVVLLAVLTPALACILRVTRRNRK